MTNPPSGQLVVAVRDLVKTYGRIRALDGVSLSVRRGEVVGLIGPNGSGKSTLVKCLAGLVRPDSGVVGLPLPGAVPSRRFVYESDALPPDMRVEAFLHCEATALGASVGSVDRSMRDTGIEALRRRTIAGLSMGNRRRVALAAALLGDFDLLVLDEPTNGLDMDGLRMVRQLIRPVTRYHLGVLFSSHTMSEVERLADRVVVINHGRVLYDGTVEGFITEAGESTLESAYEAVLSKGAAR